MIASGERELDYSYKEHHDQRLAHNPQAQTRTSPMHLKSAAIMAPVKNQRNEGANTSLTRNHDNSFSDANIRYDFSHPTSTVHARAPLAGES
jgi:hypothetical protein